MRLVLSAIFLSFIIIQGSFAHNAPVHPSERFIPIGMSPGLSKQGYTVIGCVEAVNEADQSIEVWDGENLHSAVLSKKQSRIYLDRSRDKLSNLKGSFEDINSGQKVEIEHFNHLQPSLVRWLKVEVSNSPSGCE